MARAGESSICLSHSHQGPELLLGVKVHLDYRRETWLLQYYNYVGRTSTHSGEVAFLQDMVGL